jgi:hypothetical protein
MTQAPASPEAILTAEKRSLYLMLLGWEHQTGPLYTGWKHPKGSIYAWSLNQAYEFELTEERIRERANRDL